MSTNLLTDTRAQATWDATYATDDQEISVWAQLPFVDLAIDTFRASGNGPILELPCGGGRNTVHLARALPAIVGVDLSFGALDLARRVLAREVVNNCAFVHADVGSLPFPDETFGGVFCADLLGHLREPRRALAELVRVCRPGARIVVNFFGVEDSTRDDAENEVTSEHSVVYRDVYFRYDDLPAVRRALDVDRVRLLSLNELRWAEGPHPGYRDYPHDHHGFLAVLERTS
jgi:SAM-dependent methyltransferase